VEFTTLIQLTTVYAIVSLVSTVLHLEGQHVDLLCDLGLDLPGPRVAPFRVLHSFVEASGCVEICLSRHARSLTFARCRFFNVPSQFARHPNHGGRHVHSERTVFSTKHHAEPHARSSLE
jgi:hypothetical protein